jgi:16S rRNA (guanine527-N7)-methyltransferase
MGRTSRMSMTNRSERELQLLREGAGLLGLSLCATQEQQFLTYLGEIALFNRVYKLVAAEGEDLVVKHVLDCIAAVPVFRQLLNEHRWVDPRLCDIGSGAGFPGIPLAIMLEDIQITLVERSGRRCGFLRNAVAVCNLASQVEVLEKDLSEVSGTFQLVTFRAFHPLVDIIRDVGKITTDDSVVCAYKGRLESTDEELQELERLSALGSAGSRTGWDATKASLQVPFLDAPRHMLLLKKR